MAGYWRDEATTAAAFTEGWLRTGDIGRFDEAGRLVITGRLKEVIRSGASSIVPAEVEDAIASHPAVAEVAVVGLPDREWGEVVAAFIVVCPGASLDGEAVIAHCRDRLAPHKKPRQVRFVTSIPRSHYGKVLRQELVSGAVA
jgi:long-chain acyl-CoA synthetase